MDMPRRRLIIGAAVLVGMVVFAILLFPAVPRYQGKTVSEWLKYYGGGVPSVEVVHAFGTNAMPVLAREYRWSRPVKHSRAYLWIYHKLGRFDHSATAYKWCGIALREVHYSLEAMVLTFDPDDLARLLRGRSLVRGEMKEALLDVEWNSKSEKARKKAKEVRERLEKMGGI